MWCVIRSQLSPTIAPQPPSPRSLLPRPLLSIVGAIALSPLLASAGQVNITVDDIDASIQYLSAAAWFSSRNASGCAFCLAPVNAAIAFKSTWHHGLHIIPTNDADDTPNTHVDDDDDDDDDHDHDHDDHDSGKGRGKGNGRRQRRLTRREDRGEPRGIYLEDPDAAAPVTASPFTVPKFDADDPQFVDAPVTAQFNFTGTAIYLLGLLPLFPPANSNSTPTTVNLTFTLDSRSAGTFLNVPSSDGPFDFAPNTTLLALTGLVDARHTLTVSLGPNSVLLLDSYVYTQQDLEDTGGGSTTAPNSPGGPTAVPSSVARPNTSESSSDTTKKHNTETFAAAVGASLGVLSIVASCLALSIIRRRRRSAQRERELAAAADGAVPQMAMIGPAPFVPRFFPGTVPAHPPPYAGPPGFARAGDGGGWEEDMDGLEDVPPPFTVAIAQPTSPLLASLLAAPAMALPPPRSLRAEEGGSGADGEGDPGGASTDTPLLGASSSRSRRSSYRSAAPRSRASSVVVPLMQADALAAEGRGSGPRPTEGSAHAAAGGQLRGDESEGHEDEVGTRTGGDRSTSAPIPSTHPDADEVP
ncbi:hypothetical protein OF83DRAFT_1177343 [Amylostereum chailletii]|nr:hypothetical protein OF83DRAFT_1177343 [Amylostereum chailletii]